ncbi:hypothetical protein KVV02_004301, partial [Mortierella alpina]
TPANQHTTLSLPTITIQPTANMTLFKSHKNQSASAAVSPAQTPRTSMHEERPSVVPSQPKTLTHEQAMEMALCKIRANAGPFIR